MTRARSLALASLLLAACQSAVDPDKIKPTGPATAAGLCQEITAALIDRVVQCLGVPRPWAQQGNDLLNCSKWDASVAAGRMRYDPFYGDACVQLVRTKSCAQLFGGSGGGGSLPGACGQAVQGLVPAGGACATEQDCSSGTYCSYTGGCGGTCKAYAALNQKCADNVGPAIVYTQCAPGLVCVADPAPAPTSTCISPIPLNGSCPAGYGCAEGLYCDRTAALPASWTCRTQQTSGTCTQYDACQEPFYHCSSPNPSVTPGNCRPLAQENQGCKHGYGDCVDGTYCYKGAIPLAGDSGTCTIFPGPPSVCGTYGVERIKCLGSYCSATTGPGTCTPYIPLGNACGATAPPDQCGPGKICTIPAPNVCAVACP